MSLIKRGVGVCLIVWGSAAGWAHAQASAALSYTHRQAEAGRAAYTTYCVSCHGPHLNDGTQGAPLKGPAFMKKYGDRSVLDLYRIARTTMPTANPGSLPPATYAALVAYLLQENAIVAGETELPADAHALAAMMLPASGFSIMAFSPYTAQHTVSLPNPLEHFTAVGAADLAHPPDQDWLTWRRGWNGHGFSPLDQINAANAGRLRLVWSWTLPAGSTEGVPLVRDGTLFIQGFGDTVQALNAATGDLLWQYSPLLEEGVAPFQKRGIALWGDKLYIGTSDVHVVALNVHTGKVVWDTKIGNNKIREQLNGGPLLVDGRVLVGTAGTGVGAKPGGPQLVGLDAATGRELWRLGTIAKPGEPGGDSWNGIPFMSRSGASIWTPGSYDPATGLAYFGTGNTYDTGPLLPLKRMPGISNDALYTNSTLAVDPASGKLVWYFQHFPNDQWDLDWAFERQLVDLTLEGKPRRVLITSGKIGIYDALDARTGQYLFSIDLGLQNIVRAIDPATGRKQVNTDLYPGDGKVKLVCPHGAGAKNYLPASWNPRSGILVMPLNEACMDIFPVPGGGPGLALSSGVNWGIRPRPGSDGKYGRLEALDLATRKVVWMVRGRAPITSGVLTTAGGVAFDATFDREFHAYDSANGKELWHTRLNDVSSSSPISFSVQGRQYIALVVGAGGFHARSFAPLVPELPSPDNRGATVWVFALP
ncbi:MAG TPA: PQQ-binding-like beta-propeller repeat protein [Steroidobacteraceae bacterium]|nr:PQQ-binding-like beta-propeller repeat protein [Steroidobacteraceae bacterium]